MPDGHIFFRSRIKTQRKSILAAVDPACSVPEPVVVVVEPDGLHFLQMSAAQSHHCVVVVVLTVEPACVRIYTATTSDCRRHVNCCVARDTTSKCGCRHPVQCRTSTGSGWHMKYDTAIPQLSHHAANCSFTQQTGATSDTRQCGTRQSFGSAVSSRVSPQLHVPELCWVCIHASMPTRLGVTTCVHGKH